MHKIKRGRDSPGNLSPERKRARKLQDKNKIQVNQKRDNEVHADIQLPLTDTEEEHTDKDTHIESDDESPGTVSVAAATITSLDDHPLRRARKGAECLKALRADHCVDDIERCKRFHISRIKEILGHEADIPTSLFSSATIPRIERVNGFKDGINDSFQTRVKTIEEYSKRTLEYLYYLVWIYGPAISLEDFKTMIDDFVSKRQNGTLAWDASKEAISKDLKIIVLEELESRIKNLKEPQPIDLEACADHVNDYFPLKPTENKAKLAHGLTSYSITNLFNDLNEEQRNVMEFLESPKFRFALSEASKVVDPKTRSRNIKKDLLKQGGIFEGYLESRCKVLGHYESLYKHLKPSLLRPNNRRTRLAALRQEHSFP